MLDVAGLAVQLVPGVFGVDVVRLKLVGEVAVVVVVVAGGEAVCDGVVDDRPSFGDVGEALETVVGEDPTVAQRLGDGLGLAEEGDMKFSRSGETIYWCADSRASCQVIATSAQTVNKLRLLAGDSNLEVQFAKTI